jgi:hypothetical protein
VRIGKHGANRIRTGVGEIEKVACHSSVPRPLKLKKH